MIDKYLNMNLIFDVPTSYKFHRTMVKRSQGLDGIAIGCSYTNPLFDTRDYEILFTDGTRYKYASNIV